MPEEASQLFPTIPLLGRVPRIETKLLEPVLLRNPTHRVQRRQKTREKLARAHGDIRGRGASTFPLEFRRRQHPSCLIGREINTSAPRAWDERPEGRMTITGHAVGHAEQRPDAAIIPAARLGTVLVNGAARFHEMSACAVGSLAQCPSSDDLRHIGGLQKGGSGSSVIEIMRHAGGAASDGLRLSGA